MFSSIESNAFDYYEMSMGTKGTLIMSREQDALLFEEGSAAEPFDGGGNDAPDVGPGRAVLRNHERTRTRRGRRRARRSPGRRTFACAAPAL